LSTQLEVLAQERKDEIIKFIIEHDGCTKTDVIEYMKSVKHSALQTTHKIIHELIRNQMVIVVPDKKNRQYHRLHISNNFAEIDRQISKIEKIINKMNAPIQAYFRHRNLHNDVPSLSKFDEYTALSNELDDPNKREYTNHDDIWHHFIYPYEEAVIMTLRILFKRISETILSESDADKLRRKIVTLLIKLSTQIFSLDKEREYLDFSIWELQTFRKASTKDFAKRNHIDLGIRNEIVEFLKGFEEKFLSAKAENGVKSR
jgi:hypothetical protein